MTCHNADHWTMRRGFAVVAFALAVSACSSYENPSGNPAGPTTAPPGAIVINVVGERGALSFSPNPATVAAGETVVWHNVDTETHRVVLDDRQFDTGDIAPGRFSQAMTLPAPRPYHCSIHPDMTGTIQSTQ
jgi:plastocyanin